MSIERALEVLCCFSSERPEWGCTEIAEHLGLYKSTVHRFLATFEQAGLVERTATKRYRLGIRALELGNTFRAHQKLLEAAERPLRNLAEATDCITRLVQMDGRECLVMLRVAGAHPVVFTPYPMFRMGAHHTAAGKVLLASLDETGVNRYIGVRRTLKPLTPKTIVDPDELRCHLGRVAAQGYAVDDEESTRGQRCLAVPVHDRQTGATIAAISISGTSEKFSDEDIPHYVARLAETAKAIAKALG